MTRKARHETAADPAHTGPGRLHNVPVLREERTHATGAVLLPVVCCVVFAASVALDLAAPETGPGVRYAEDPGWPFALNGVFLGLLAVPILRGREARMFGWLLGLLGVFWALDGLAQSYIRAGVTDEHIWPWMTFSVWFLERFGAFLPVSIMALVLIFPNGRFMPGVWGVIGRAALATAVGCGLALLVMPLGGELSTTMRALPPEINVDPVTINALDGNVDTVRPILIGVFLAAFVVALVLVVVRYRRSRGLTRDRMRWLAWSVVVIVGYQLVSVVVLDFDGTDYVGIVVAMVLPGAAMTVAIVRPTLVAIDDLLGRTMVVVAIVAALVAADVRRARRPDPPARRPTSPRRRWSPSYWWLPLRSTVRSGCASPRRSSAGCSASGATGTTRSPACRRPSRTPTTRVSSWPPLPAPSLPLSASGS